MSFFRLLPTYIKERFTVQQADKIFVSVYEHVSVMTVSLDLVSSDTHLRVGSLGKFKLAQCWRTKISHFQHGCGCAVHGHIRDMMLFS